MNFSKRTYITLLKLNALFSSADKHVSVPSMYVSLSVSYLHLRPVVFIVFIAVAVSFRRSPLEGCYCQYSSFYMLIMNRLCGMHCTSKMAEQRARNIRGSEWNHKTIKTGMWVRVKIMYFRACSLLFCHLSGHPNTTDCRLHRVQN